MNTSIPRMAAIIDAHTAMLKAMLNEMTPDQKNKVAQALSMEMLNAATQGDEQKQGVMNEFLKELNPQNHS